MSREARVGALVLAIFALLVYLAPGRAQRTTVLGNAYNLVFENVNGLREGDPVKVVGVPAGRVVGIDFTTRSQKDLFGPDARVVARIITDFGVSIPEDSRYSVEFNLSGQRWVEITPGQSEVALEPDSVTKARLRSARKDQFSASLLAFRELSTRTEDIRAVLSDPVFRRSMKDMASNARFYSNEFVGMSGRFDEDLARLERNLDTQERALLAQMARIDVQVDVARKRTEELVPQVREGLGAWEARMRGSEGEFRAMMDTALRETERFRKIAQDAEKKFVGGKMDDRIREQAQRLINKIDEFSALAEDLHALSSSPETKAEIRGMIEKYRRQAEELRQNLERWEQRIP